jgi:hypothetical protein
LGNGKRLDPEHLNTKDRQARKEKQGCCDWRCGISTVFAPFACSGVNEKVFEKFVVQH